MFRELKQEVEGCMAMSFAGDCGWMVVAYLVDQLCERLGRTGIRAME